MWNCNEIERSSDFRNIANYTNEQTLHVNNATRTVIKSALKFRNSNLPLTLLKFDAQEICRSIYLTVIKPTVK